MLVKKLLREELNQMRPYYHGSRSAIPFEKFESAAIGSGLVSSRKTYGGFFFTSEFENAEYYTEWFVCEVTIKGVTPFTGGRKNPPENMKQAITDKKIYLIPDILDGAVHSDIVVVPASLVNNVSIVNWNFVGDEPSYFEHLDEYFKMGHDDEDGEETFITQDFIESMFMMTGGGLDYALQIPIFRKYFDSKG